MATIKKKVAPKKAAPKKKAAPVKGAWVPPWAKKAVEEKKTGEKYASKAAMAKHEKGESKKMRMKEGEIPMKRKGGKTCSCGKAGCMTCGGVKKHELGGLQTQMGKIMKSQGQQARKAGLTKKLDGMGLFNMSEMKIKPVRKGATGAELKAEGIALKKKGMALKKKGQSMR